MLTVHHLNRSRSTRVLWLLEELELPYELVRYDRDPRTLLAPAALQSVHALGKSPVLTDGDLVLAESGAIIEYVLERYGAGRLVPPPASKEFLSYRYFLHYAEGSLMPPLLVNLIMGRVKSAPLPFFVRPIAKRVAEGVIQQFCDPNIARHLAYLDGVLRNSEWFAGDTLTGADIQMSYPVEALLSRAGKLSVPATLLRFSQRVHARSAYIRALDKGGPVELG